ncbi:unnamed protein product [Clonostachys chloroleuca]|uniref:Uncharacterized protein n=1 Tax=Clonostachys chloroleuca TaxID=1926264 RepID=A0AA35QA42_9HYPO|nr:unnamed protein product [Clonostachys chloroleuca]
MKDASDTIRAIQSGLEPYIKPREQVNYIRRILALQLGSYTNDKKLPQPLALSKPPHDFSSAFSEAKGVHKEYLQALKDNEAARRGFEDVLLIKSKQGRSVSPTAGTGEEFLEEQLAILKLRRKREKFLAIQQCIDDLFEKPAALPSYLDADSLFAGAAQLPAVPREIVESLAVEGSTAGSDPKAREVNMEKTILRAKLLLREEQDLLQEARSNSRSNPDVLSNAAKATALDATRNELISWMEAELGVAGSEEQNESAGGVQLGDLKATQAALTNDLAQIGQKYALYCSLRKDILVLVSQSPQPAITPDLQHKSSPHIAQPENPDVDYLLTPYITKLLALSKTQKAMISQKAHINSTLGQYTKDSGQIFDRLAEESQLLPAHRNETDSRPGLTDPLSKSSHFPEATSRITPWVLAADSAKISNLELVAETMEGGHIFLENSAQSLHEINNLLGLNQPKPEGAEAQGDDDFWLESENPKGKKTRKHTEERPEQKKGDIWSALHGNLGLLGQDRSA